MRKTVFTAIFIMLGIFNAIAKDITVVWDNPTTEYGSYYNDGFFLPVTDVTKVEITESETNVYITLSMRNDDPRLAILFSSKTYILADGNRYGLTKADGITLDTACRTGNGNKRDMVFHFKPLPSGTRSFDLNGGDEPGALQIKGIKPVEERHRQLFPSYWRNEKTGDWEIAFLDDFVIYDCRFWNYKTKPVVKNEADKVAFTITDGKEELQISVSKDNKGKRSIQIGKAKGQYSMITDRFLPDYPTKDTRCGFTSDYTGTDSVTLVGWLKDMPEMFRSRKEFTVSMLDFIKNEDCDYTSSLDSYGRFSIKIPLTNSSGFFCDWGRSYMQTVLEPGRTYFLLYDYKEGRRLIMGEDARLQNELMKYPLEFCNVGMKPEDDPDNYIELVNNTLYSSYNSIDRLCNELHPTLSSRFRIYKKRHIHSQLAKQFASAQFYMPNSTFTPAAAKYAYDTFWTKMEKPYELNQNYHDFAEDYINGTIKISKPTYISNWQDYIDDLKLSEDGKALAKGWSASIREFEAQEKAEPDMDKKIKMIKKFNADNADIIHKFDSLITTKENERINISKWLICNCRNGIIVLDSLNASQDIKDAWLFGYIYKNIDHERRALTGEVIDSLESWIHSQKAMDMVRKANDKYLAIENRSLGSTTLSTGKELEGISEGKALLNKILEPHKGRIVLLDIWGTWCSPCKENLSHSDEEFARLAPYDMVYIYLANKSNPVSWKNVIKQYNVTGSNVIHYNLPEGQQKAIERYLNITHFPTYKLFDRNGNMSDVSSYPLNLDALENSIRMIQ